MTRALLDTHALLWWLAEPERLSKNQFALISAPNSQIFVSAASIWEIRIKESLGKLEVPSDIVDLIEQDGFEFLSVSHNHADLLKALPPIHKDPFDRILISQAKVEQLVLVSADRVFKEYDVETIP